MNRFIGMEGKMDMGTIPLNDFGISKRGLESALERGIGFRPSIFDSIHGGEKVFVVPYKDSRATELFKFSVRYQGQNGSDVSHPLILKHYKRDSRRKGERKLNDETTLLRFYEQYCGGEHFPLLHCKMVEKGFFIRDYIPGATYEEVNDAFVKKIVEAENTILHSEDMIEKQRAEREKKIFERNQRYLLNLVIGILAKIHHIGTSNLEFLRKKTEIARYRIRSPGIEYYREDFVTYVTKLLGAYTRGKEEQNKELRNKLALIFSHSRGADYIGKKVDLVLGDVHARNIVIASATGEDNAEDLFGPSSLDAKSDSLVQRIYFTDVGRGRVGTAVSDLVDILNYPNICSDIAMKEDALIRYVNERARFEGRVATATDLGNLLDGYHFLTIFKSPHASVVDEQHRKQYFELLMKELERDNNLAELKAIFAPIASRIL